MTEHSAFQDALQHPVSCCPRVEFPRNSGVTANSHPSLDLRVKSGERSFPARPMLNLQSWDMSPLLGTDSDFFGANQEKRLPALAAPSRPRFQVCVGCRLEREQSQDNAHRQITSVITVTAVTTCSRCLQQTKSSAVMNDQSLSTAGAVSGRRSGRRSLGG